MEARYDFSNAARINKMKVDDWSRKQQREVLGPPTAIRLELEVGELWFSIRNQKPRKFRPNRKQIYDFHSRPLYLSSPPIQS